MATDTIPSRLFLQAKKHGGVAAYHFKEKNAWQSVSWQGYADQVEQVGRALMHLGFEKEQATCILGFNRPEWCIFDIAKILGWPDEIPLSIHKNNLRIMKLCFYMIK